MLPVRLGMLLALNSERSLKADHAEGKLPLKPLPSICSILRSVSIFRLSKGPVSLGQPLRYNSVSFVRLEKDWGMVPDNELLEAIENLLRLVILPTTSSFSVSLGLLPRSRFVRLVRADHV